MGNGVPHATVVIAARFPHAIWDVAIASPVVFVEGNSTTV